MTNAAKLPLIDPALVSSLFRYEEAAGRLYWLSRTPDRPAGAMASQYWAISIFGRRYFAHRLVWAWHTREWPKGEIDHINGDKLDNRFENLRDVTRRVNKQNIRTPNRNNVGLLGTHLFRNGRWKSSINVNGRNVHLGYFDTTEEAHEAYLRAKRANHPGGTL